MRRIEADPDRPDVSTVKDRDLRRQPARRRLDERVSRVRAPACGGAAGQPPGAGERIRAWLGAIAGRTSSGPPGVRDSLVLDQSAKPPRLVDPVAGVGSLSRHISTWLSGPSGWARSPGPARHLPGAVPPWETQAVTSGARLMRSSARFPTSSATCFERIASYGSGQQMRPANQQLRLHPEYQAGIAEVVRQAADAPHAFGDRAERAKVLGDHWFGLNRRFSSWLLRWKSMVIRERRARVLIHVGGDHRRRTGRSAATARRPPSTWSSQTRPRRVGSRSGRCAGRAWNARGRQRSRLCTR